MKLAGLYCGLLWTVFASLGFGQSTPAQIRQVDSVLTTLHQQGSFSGAVLIAENDRIVYKKALGYTDLSNREVLKTTSAFNLASVSKQFVAALVMILHDQGKLHFDDKVQQHLPSFPYPSISIRHLLTHTSGLQEYFDLAIQYNNTLDTLTNDKLIELLHRHHPAVVFAAGDKWEYCNTNYVLLASIVEKAAGMPIDRFFKQQITQPLGLNDTYIYCLQMKQSPTNRVLGFERKNGKNSLNDLVRLDGVIGDGNVYSSVEDLFKWQRALLGIRLVKPTTWKQAISPARLNNGTTHNYGFGLFLENNGSVISHTGGWVGFGNELWHDTSTGQTLVFLSNGSNGSARGFLKDILTQKPIKLPRFQLITNVNVVDGTGLAAKRAAVRLKNDRIWEIGDLQAFVGESVVDGQGLSLAPGFIDSHSHHFGGLEDHPDASATLNQGITTIVIGQDGGSIPIDTIQAFFKNRPVAINVATYTGHSTLRAKAMGAKSLFRTAKPEEVEKMKIQLKSEMQKGSLGLATGLEYESAFFSNRDEVLQLAQVAADAGGRYMSHIRSEDINLDEAIDEIIEIGRRTKMPVQISHIKIAKRAQWGQSEALLARLQQARAQGVNITADCYPYDFWNSTLRVLFPNRDYTNLASAELAVSQLCDPDKSVVVRFAPNKAYAGKTLSQIAAMRKEPPAQTLMALIAQAADFEEKNPDFEEGIEAIMGKSMDETDVTNFLSWSQTNICSDGAWRGHPRGHGAFTKLLGTYVRERKAIPLETAIYKMTGLTAEHLGLPDRGLVRPGYYADLVLFDPKTVKDNASIQNPTALSTGIEKVWVNGELVYQSQQSTGVFSGRFLKRN